MVDLSCLIRQTHHDLGYPQDGERPGALVGRSVHAEAMDELARLLAEQNDVVSRRQLHQLGFTPADLERMVRRRELSSLHRGVFVAHTGPPGWQQRAWGAVLYAWPAALTHASAVRAAEGPGRRGGDPPTIDVAVTDARRLAPPKGVRIIRTRGFERRVQWNFSPPRIRYEEAILDVAADASTDVDAIGVLADAVGGRRTTARRLAHAAEQRQRLSRRAWLTGILDDVATGSQSVLEHGYLERVERTHALPLGQRQHRTTQSGGFIYEDVRYRDYGTLVELDGRLFHGTSDARDRDLGRDLESLQRGLATVRLGYGQIFGTPCATAAQVGTLLALRGWAGTLRRCPACP